MVIIVLLLMIVLVIVALVIEERRNMDANRHYVSVDLDIQKIIQDSIEEALMDIEIDFCESHGLGMGGSPYHFAVEDMTMHEARWLTAIIDSYLRSHDLVAKISYKMIKENEDGI